MITDTLYFVAYAKHEQYCYIAAGPFIDINTAFEERDRRNAQDDTDRYCVTKKNRT